MTVVECVKKYGLEEYDKEYKNQYGNARNLMNLDKLATMEVKGIYINFPTKSVTITIIERDEWWRQ